MNEALVYTIHPSAIGQLLLVASNRGVQYLTLLADGQTADAVLDQHYPTSQLAQLDGFFTSTVAEIDRYLAGGGELKLPVDLCGGTPLQRMVWLEIARIPYGETISYTTLAERVGFPRAVRAVASACGANPVPLIIPCHRVLAKDGSMGGFSLGGIHIKEILLQAESEKPQVAAA